MNKKFLTLVAIGALVSVVTFVGLNISSPYSKPVVAVDSGVSVDEVFTGGLQLPAAEAAPAQ